MKPLATTVRRRVLWFMFFMFLVLTPMLIGYSKGYRLDDALDLIQTGGIYIRSDIANTSVFLDDEFVENNGTLTKNTLIQDLLPNRYYAVRVQREGYQSWVKVLSVKPNLATEAQVLMLPTIFDWKSIPATSTVALTDVEEGATSTEDVPNPEYVALKEYFLEDKDQFEVAVATSTYEYIRGVRYASTTNVIETRFPEWMSKVASSTNLIEKEMVREREGIVTWLENGDLFAVWARENDTVPYFFCAETCVDKLAINWAEPILRYEFYPNRNDLVVVLSIRGVYVIELDNRSERNLQTILEEPNLDFRFQPDGSLVIFDGKEFRKTSW